MSPASLLPQIRLVGDEGILLEFDNIIDPQVNERVLGLYRLLQEKPWRGVRELVPAYRTLLIIYDPLVVEPQKLGKKILAQAGNIIYPPLTPSREVHLPVCYGGDLGPDIAYVAEINGLTVPEVIALHIGPLYRVYMLGFTPGFPYLGGLAERIRAPRRATPRTEVAAGSVGIANDQTGIYPLKSPGGWQIIGRTPVKLFSTQKEPPALLAAGDGLRFYPVSREEFDHLQSREEG